MAAAGVHVADGRSDLQQLTHQQQLSLVFLFCLMFWLPVLLFVLF
jgi:hypothetical protein